MILTGSPLKVSSISVLYIDDEKNTLEITKQYMEESGEFVFDTVHSAQTALETLDIPSYDVIVSNHILPDMDGISFLRIIRERYGDIPFILFIAESRIEVLLEAIHNRADFFLHKGADPQTLYVELAHRIRQEIQKRHLERASLEHDEKIRTVLEKTGAIIYSISSEGIVTLISPNVNELLGYPVHEIIGRPVEQFIHPDDISRIRESIFGAYTTGKQISGMMCRIRHSNGTWFWYIISLTPVYDSQGNIIILHGISHDITEKITTQTAIQMMIESMVGTTGIPSLLKIAENVTSWLGADCVMIGEIQSDHQTVQVLAMILDGEEVKNFTYRLKGTPCDNVAQKGFCYYPDDAIRLFPESKDLQELHIRAYIGTPLKNSQGEVIGVLCALFRNPLRIAFSVEEFFSIVAVKAGIEIERFRIEQELTENRQILARAMELTNLATWERDLTSGEFIFNDRFYAQCGTTAEREGGYRIESDRYIREFVHPDDQKTISAVMPPPGFLSSDTNSEREIEHRIIRRDGEVRDILVKIGFLTDSKKTVIKRLGANLDITERKKAEEVLRRVNRQLNLLTSITRHDILNSITIIYNYLDLTETDYSDQTLSKYVKSMKKATNEIQSQIEFTQVYEKLGSHKPNWIPLKSVMPYASLPSDITFTVDTAGIEIYADPMLDKVFFNLLDNSVRHGQRVTRIRVSVHESDDMLKVLWEDNGIGIPQNEKSRIFFRGFGKNTGFGMFLVQEILSLTDITIQETGIEGEGIRFEILVPKGSWRSE